LTTPHRRRHVATAAVLFGVAAGMVGLAYASVPLYRLFCQVTGFAGTPKTEGVVASTAVGDKVVAVRFDANVNSGLPWSFKPGQRQVEVRLGEERLAHYVAVNRSDRPLTGTATFTVTPYKVAQYFSKVQCFCFEEQTLLPGQEVIMPVVFYVDPAILDDPDARDVTRITLSYTFFPVEPAAPARGTPEKVAERRPGDSGR
jgi:cytochrome c oxidase assembly protein subunit 11